ncbi:hypothetical protein [Allorhodopirellula heiligendammensis]|uniref:Uncharacterized protein n=1 Tax=Allorhodopirellula heiligendammensis TaxID=2714739 RepID=A0A5C6BH07_9BACT|nr:hypothetical protein [Allorhodopirellula heiligendammensis]TWU10937.1 hypothetical protein Poly21_48430 [Allorhodopirellula heiligendammensis]
MPRQKRSDEAGIIYHALNRGNDRNEIFKKPEDYDAFIRIVDEGLQKYPVELFSLEAAQRSRVWGHSSFSGVDLPLFRVMMIWLSFPSSKPIEVRDGPDVSSGSF